jgi:FkbM family methyltransferase
MRFEDVTDYLKLRRIAENPREIVRYRKRQFGTEDLHVNFLGRPGLHLRGGRADYHMFHRIYLRDEYELNPLLERGLDCVIDLGGNVGIFSSRVAPHAKKVVTCEPVPENFARLEMNLGDYDNIERLKIAVTDTNGTLEIFMPAQVGATGVFSAHREGNEERLSDESIEVESVSFATLLETQDIDEVDLLKIDVEGGEYDILYSATDLLPRVKRIHGEYHDVRADDPRTRIDNFASWLRDRGYSKLRVDDHPKMPNHGMFFASR